MVQKSRVALIEDSEECREILATMIRLMGYEVIFPVENFVDGDVDVIVVYLDFPQMNTLRTIYALREDQRTKSTPIIVYLPWKYTDAASASLKAGANEVFDGPLTFETLLDGIAKYVTITSDKSDSSIDNVRLKIA